MKIAFFLIEYSSVTFTFTFTFVGQNEENNIKEESEELRLIFTLFIFEKTIVFAR
jgi:hypothetical protein